MIQRPSIPLALLLQSLMFMGLFYPGFYGTARADTACEIAGQKQHYEDVLDHCRKAAEQDNPQAAFRMGEAYEFIEGEKRSALEASNWYLIAAQQGHSLAQRNLAALYDKGYGVPKDSYYAFTWYKRAADQGQKHSELMVGMMYLYGTGTLRDVSEGRKWIAKAAESGEANAQYMHGKLLYPNDPVTAIDWYQKSARQNNFYAQYRLGLLHYLGEQLGLDLDLARDYANQAKTGGHPRAALLLQKIDEKQRQLALIGSASGKNNGNSAMANASNETTPLLAVTAQPKTAERKPEKPQNNTTASRPVKTQVITKSAESGLQWLQAQPGENYSIQLALMSKYSSVERFYRRYGLQQNTHHYRSQFKAGPRYLLLHGSYPSNAEAQKALQQLPKAVKKMKPWIRRLGDLQASYQPVEG